jgi:2-oxoglutarate dehydrogenase E2 component (dihydrolipoamide succinyltransferase)
MKVRVRVPKVGLTVEQVTFTSWEKKEGDRVSADDVIAIVEGDKASFEITAPVAGTLTQCMAAVGDTLPIGTDIAVIES